MAINRGIRGFVKHCAPGFEHLEGKGCNWGMRYSEKIRPHVREIQGRPRGEHSSDSVIDREPDYEALDRRYDPGEPTEQGGWPLDPNHYDYRKMKISSVIGVEVGRISFGVSYAGEEHVVISPEGQSVFNPPA